MRSSRALSNHRFFLLPLALTFFLASCQDDRITPPEGLNPGEARLSAAGNTSELFPSLPEMIEPVEIQLPDEPLPWLVSDEALIEAVREAGGKVHIGFKPPEARHSLETGLILGMRRAEALEYHRQIEAAGAEILRTFRTSASVVAKISPEIAPILLTLPIVDYLEPGSFYRIAQQDTSWGVHKVRAPLVWSSDNNTRGASAHITILDTGIDFDHWRLTSGDGNTAPYECRYEAPYTACWDDEGHGTHVAGIALAENNTYGFLESPIVLSVTPASRCVVRMGPAIGLPLRLLLIGRHQMAKLGRSLA